jgi:hypothetical protein
MQFRLACAAALAAFFTDIRVDRSFSFHALARDRARERVG